MRIFYIKNLTRKKINSICSEKIPITDFSKFESKDSFRKWCSNENTEHFFVSLCEGKNPNCRINKENQCKRINGIMVDFDKPKKKPNLQNLKFNPQFYTISFSGGYHFFWEFDHPVEIENSNELASYFLENIIEKIGIKEICDGYDEMSHRPTSFMEFGGEKIRISEEKISQGFTSEVYEETKSYYQFLNKKDNKILISKNLELSDSLKNILKEHYPKFNKNIKVGERTICFWEEESEDPKSTIIFGKGAFCHSANRGWKSWKDLLGSSYNQESKKIDISLENFISKYYYSYEKDSFFTFFGERIVKPVSSQAFSDNYFSEGFEKEDLKQTRNSIRKNNVVIGAYPFPCSTKKIIKLKEGKDTITFLNSSISKSIESEKGEFIHLNEFLLSIFKEKDLEYFISTIARKYKSIKENTDKKTLAIFIVGGVGIGKTFLSCGVLSKLFGGHADPTSFFNGETNFNSHIFEKPLLCIDDKPESQVFFSKTRFSQNLKRFVANQTLNFSKKNSPDLQLPFSSQIICTLNEDVESLSAGLPESDLNMDDKILVLKLKEDAKKLDSELAEKILDEVKYFANFLMEYETPKEIHSSRFGVKGFIDPEVETICNSTKIENCIKESLFEWINENFYYLESRKMTARQILLALKNDSIQGSMFRKDDNHSLRSFSRKLNQISKNNEFIEDSGYIRNVRVYKLTKNIDIEPKNIKTIDFRDVSNCYK